MSNTISQGIAFVKAHPTRKNVPGAKYRLLYGWSWSQLCVALVYWAVGASHSYDTANEARAASKIVSTSRDVPDGAIVWFDMGADGHVGFWSGGVFYSATKFASNLGTALGTMTLEQYEKASGGKYRGYSWDFGGQKFAGLSLSGVGDVTPITEPAIIEEDMKLITHPNGQPALVGEATFLQIASSTMTDLESIWGPHIPVSADAWTFQQQRSLETRAAQSATNAALPVDVNALAKALAPLLPTPLSHADLVATLNKALAYTPVS